MTTNQPLQSISNRRRRLDVVVQPSFLHDVLIALWSALGANDKAATHELGKRWFTDLRRRIGPELADEIASFGGESGKLWLSLTDLVASAPNPEDVVATIEWIRGADWAERRIELFSEMCWKAEPTDVQAALNGDSTALERCLVEYPDGDREAMERWITYPADDFPRVLADVLTVLVSEVMPDETAEWGDAYRCSKDAVEPMIGMIEPPALIERVTNGIAYDIPLGVRRVVLIPSMVLRPWTVTYEMGDRVYVMYPVADEHAAADPDAPPQWVVKIHKALGDDRRLRMLRRLADEPAGLAELTSEIGLAKSTVFHHIGVLRAAGLVRVQVGRDTDKNPLYSLRPGALETAFDHTRKYLEVPERTDG